MADARLNSFHNWIRRHKAALITVLCWGVLLFVGQQYMTANNLTVTDLTSRLAKLSTDPWAGPLAYFGVYLVVRPLLLLPPSVLTILAGHVFGLKLGFLYALLAGTLSAILPYLVGRWLSSEQIAGANPRSPAERFRALLHGNPFQAILLLRLLYLPYDLVSVSAGYWRIGFRPFFLATAVGNIGPAFGYVGLGASIEGDLTSGGEIHLNSAVLALSLAVLITSLLVSRVVKIVQKRRDVSKVERAS